MPYIIDNVMMAARTHLNDDGAINWPDKNLLPKLQEAFRDLRLELSLNGIQVLSDVTTDITVTTGTTDLSTMTGYPTDLVAPIDLYEKQTGETDSYLTQMTQVDFLPNISQDTRLNYWTWQRGTIFLVGALNNVIVQLRYRKDLTIPMLNSDSVGIILGESFLSYRTAAIACSSTKDFNSADRLNAQAQVNLSKVVRFFVTYEKQTMPAKRRAYHRGNNYRNVGF